MFDIHLDEALKREGCPLCWLAWDTQERYIFHTLWENVNDMTFRRRFLASEGLCQTHAWRFQTTEEEMWRDGLKNGILYESLVDAVRRDLERQLQAHRQDQHPWWHPSRWRPQPSSEALLGSGLCPVCDVGQATARFYAGNLAQRLTEPGWQVTYRNSDGLCLVHFRLTLERSEPAVREWLLTEMTAQLRLLQQEMNEYIRKHSWQFQEEPVSESERQSWIRAITFLRGAKPAPQDRP